MKSNTKINADLLSALEACIDRLETLDDADEATERDYEVLEQARKAFANAKLP